MVLHEQDMRFFDMDQVLQERFWGLVDRQADTECWEWTGGRIPAGYGRFYFNGKDWGAHRFAYLLAYGAVSEDMYVCHHCDNKLCCNPRHLFLGTPLVNSQDMCNKGRAATGNQNGNTKLTCEGVRCIRKLSRNGTSQREIAREFGISRRTVHLIIRRKTWRHVA